MQRKIRSSKNTKDKCREGVSPEGSTNVEGCKGGYVVSYTADRTRHETKWGEHGGKYAVVRVFRDDCYDRFDILESDWKLRRNLKRQRCIGMGRGTWPKRQRRTMTNAGHSCRVALFADCCCLCLLERGWWHAQSSACLTRRIDRDMYIYIYIFFFFFLFTLLAVLFESDKSGMSFETL